MPVRSQKSHQADNQVQGMSGSSPWLLGDPGWWLLDRGQKRHSWPSPQWVFQGLGGWYMVVKSQQQQMQSLVCVSNKVAVPLPLRLGWVVTCSCCSCPASIPWCQVTVTCLPPPEMLLRSPFTLGAGLGKACAGRLLLPAAPRASSSVQAGPARVKLPDPIRSDPNPICGRGVCSERPPLCSPAAAAASPPPFA